MNGAAMKTEALDSAKLTDTPSTYPAAAPEIPDHQLLHRIGSGSYGEVWMARNAIGTLRAVKIVHRQSFQHAEHFEREFKGLLKFEPISRAHEGLVDVLQIGRHDDAGYFYYVMELADDAKPDPGCQMLDAGSQSADARQRNPASSIQYPESYTPRTLRSDLQARGRLPPAECVALGLKLAAALEHLHTHSLVHRDIKPSNIIFVDGEPKLADIGLVTAIAEAHSLVGTAGYIPPEGPGTPQADLYSLGKVLYEIALGKDRQDFPQLPPDLQSHPDYAALLELNEVILKACETDPHRRYATATALGEDLARLQQGRSVKRRHTAERRWGFVKKYGFATAAVALLVAGGWLLSNRFGVPRTQRVDAPSAPGPAATQARFVAVLPFDNESLDKADEYLGQSIADELNGALAKIPELRVLGRDSAAALKGAKDRRAAAQQLKVGTVLVGHLRKSASQLRLTAQLLNAADDSLLWSEVYDREMREVFGIQTDIAEKVAERLSVKLPDTVRQRLALKPTKDLEAYQLCLEGRYFWNRRPNADAARAKQLFQQAIEKDPNYAAAYSGLADSCPYATDPWASGPYLVFTQTWSVARLNAAKAVELDDNLSEAHASLAYVRENFYWDWAGAEMEFRRALELNPNNATVRSWYAIHLGRVGQYEPAIQEASRAQELDPLAPMRSRVLAWMLLASRRYDEAILEYERSLRLGPSLHQRYTGPGDCYFYRGKYEEALDAFEKGVKASGVDPKKTLLRYEALRQAYRSSGPQGYWQKELELMKAEWPELGDATKIAILYAWLGDKEQTLDWLEKASAEHGFGLENLNLEPTYDPVRADPRYRAVLKKMGLPEPVWK